MAAIQGPLLIQSTWEMPSYWKEIYYNEMLFFIPFINFIYIFLQLPLKKRKFHWTDSFGKEIALISPKYS